ncbi:hypothetical protein JI667_12430 [Bacillus sp. NTK074B]|uniref:hypothetical protein n=1 Tax=Bacillus sp. NTK074B TaxID=2802174 RepID=UPI001A8F549F|nr:hypothetical protein [Bacillus sp. NTK074B]
MTKEKIYPKFWLFATGFTCFWILYGCFILIKDMVIKDSFNWQPLYLIGGMAIMLARSVQEYKMAKNHDTKFVQK